MRFKEKEVIRMTKVRISLSLDYGVWIDTRSNIDNVSGLINSILKEINQHPDKQDLFDVNKLIMKKNKELKDKEDKLKILNEKVKELESNTRYRPYQ